jgi:hypothetical protein
MFIIVSKVSGWFWDGQSFSHFKERALAFSLRKAEETIVALGLDAKLEKIW